MDSTYAKALKRKRELEDELYILNGYIEAYKTVQTVLSAEKEETVEDLLASGPAPQRKETARTPLTPAQVVGYAKKIIVDRGRPLTRTEIANALERDGHIINAADKSKYVGTILWRNSDVFEKADGAQGYWVTGAKKDSEFWLTDEDS